MDPRQRLDDSQESLLMALDGRQAAIHTALPGIIQSFNAAAMTAVVQPATLAQVQDEAGTAHWVKLPLLVDCPVHFPSGGGFTLTFPLAAGDEVLVVLAERCIDGWWQSGSTQPQAELRMHDLSDGFVIPKVWSKPKALAAISGTTTQLRSDDGTTYVEIATGQVVNVVAPTQIVLNSPLVVVTGAITVQNSGAVSQPFAVTGSIGATGVVIAGYGSADQVSLQTHKHTGVTTGSGTTGSPQAGT